MGKHIQKPQNKKSVITYPINRKRLRGRCRQWWINIVKSDFEKRTLGLSLEKSEWWRETAQMIQVEKALRGTKKLKKKKGFINLTYLHGIQKFVLYSSKQMQILWLTTDNDGPILLNCME